MTENDYIAEYIKEKYPTLLGFDFVFWKVGKMSINAGRGMVEAFRDVNWSRLNSLDDKSEVQDADSD